MMHNLFATIRNARPSVNLVAAISFILLCTSSAKAGTMITQSTCPVVILQSGEYDLATDVGPCLPGVDGIDIVASGVTLHLNGHNIIGSADPTVCNASDGIHVGLPAPTPMLSQVRVLGPGTISNFGAPSASAGFFAENSAGSFVKFVTVTCPVGSVGFFIAGPGGQWKLQGNVVREGPPNDFCNILLINADDNELVGNNLNNAICISSSNNTVVNNTINDGANGIETRGLTTNNEIHANTINNNKPFSGITIAASSTANNITGNKSFGNSPYDMEDDNPGCDSNKWEGNHFDAGSASQSCIN